MSFGYQVLGFGTVAGVPFDASGGTVTTSGDYTIHSFTSSGTFTVNSAPADSTVGLVAVKVKI